VAGTFKLDFGWVSLMPPRRIARRQFWDLSMLNAVIGVTGRNNGHVSLFELETEGEDGEPHLNASTMIDDK
jgi:hypothetical protein